MVSSAELSSIATIDELMGELRSVPADASGLGSIIATTPDKLKTIAHYAAIFGVGDDLYRDRIMSAIGGDRKANLKWLIVTFDDALDEWLAGPEAQHATATAAYLAFSNMRIEVDELA